MEQTRLFSGIPREDIKCILECVGARREEFAKGQTILHQGDAITEIGIVLSGQGRSVMQGASGKTFIVAVLSRGSFIGLFLAAGRERRSPVLVQALEPLSAVFIPFDPLVTRCARTCPRHDILLRNCFACISEKAMGLYERIDCLIRPSVRERVMAYLTRLSEESGSRVFMTPLDRSAMAEYINVDRSALSRELSRMKNDGLIDYYKNSFKLL